MSLHLAVFAPSFLVRRAIPALIAMLAMPIVMGPAGAGEILFAERHPGRDPSRHYYSNFGYACTNENEWLHGKDGGRLAILDTATGKVRTLIEDAGGAFRDPSIHYDGKQLVFSYRKGGTHHYNLYTINIDGSGLRQITFGDWDDIEPCWLPDGGIVFPSSRCMCYVQCWFAPVATLHRCEADGSGLRRLSSGIGQENTPSVLPDGRLLFTRWEYNHRASTSFKGLWTMNPDGSRPAAYFGNSHPDGYAYIGAKPILGTNKVIFVRGEHCSVHGEEHIGSISSLEVTSGPDNKAQEKPLFGGRWRDPYPISEVEFLVAREREIVALVPGGQPRTLFTAAMTVNEPRPVAPRPREAVIPSRVDLSKTTGTLFLANTYLGRNLKDLKPGSIKKLLVMEQLPKGVNFHGGCTAPVAHGGKWSINRILGTVPVEADGSACFEVPAMRSIYLALLDENDLSIKQMRSFLTVQPGERASCIGCHEDRNSAPPPGNIPLAAKRAPSPIQPIPDAPEILDFPRDVQPILDKNCVSCHNPDRRQGGVDLCGDRGPWYSMGYYSLLLHRQVKDTAGWRWAGERNNESGEPLGNDAPYEAFSSAAPLMRKLDGSHHDAKLSAKERMILRLWLDSATPYAGTNAAYGSGQIGAWWRNNEAIREMTDSWPSTPAIRDAMKRRCSSCHENRMPPTLSDPIPGGPPYGDMEGFNRITSRFARHNLYNLSRPEKSLALMATLAKAAGGSAEGPLPAAKPVPADFSHAPKPIVHPVVFASKDDPDYKAILAHIEAGKTRLNEIKRFDMPGFRPNPQYLREMKRDGALPASFDPAKDACDPYETDRKYWQLLWHRPLTDPAKGK